VAVRHRPSVSRVDPAPVLQPKVVDRVGVARQHHHPGHGSSCSSSSWWSASPVRGYSRCWARCACASASGSRAHRADRRKTACSWRIVGGQDLQRRPALDRDALQALAQLHDRPRIVRPVASRRCRIQPNARAPARRTVDPRRAAAEPHERAHQQPAGAFDRIQRGLIGRQELSSSERGQRDATGQLLGLGHIAQDGEVVDHLIVQVVVDLRLGARLTKQHGRPPPVGLDVDPVRGRRWPTIQGASLHLPPR
jgi:hypothetical protein